MAKRYLVNATLKSNPADAIQFVVSADGYKQSWIDARNALRVGAPVENESGESVQFDSGAYIVRSVFCLDKPERRPTVGASDLIDAARKNGVSARQIARLESLLTELTNPNSNADESTDE